MRSVLVIGTQRAGSKNDPDLLWQSLVDANVKAELVDWSQLFYSVRAGNVSIQARGAELSDSGYDLVIALGWYKSGSKAIYRDMAFALALYLKEHKIACWNSEMANQRSTGKLSCMIQLAYNDVPVPDTSFALDGSLLTGSQPLPNVLKSAHASRGDKNYLVSTEEDFARVMTAEIEPNTLLVQPFMDNDHDLRVICFGGKPVLVLKRSRAADSSSHMNNTSQGAHAEWLPLRSVNPYLLTISEKICKVMGREMAGIDYIPSAESSSGYACLEVNAIPQLTSGHDSAIKLAAFVKSVQAESER